MAGTNWPPTGGNPELGEKEMKTGDIITAIQVRDLINSYGVECAFLDGAEAEVPVASDIADGEQYSVEINYGHGVKLHMVSSEVRAIIVLRDLKGRVEGSEWVA
jgi:hypothetical protein